MKQIFLLIIALFVLTCIGTLKTQANAKNLSGFIYIPATSGINSYYIGQYPITNAQYKAFLEANKSVQAPKYWKGGTYPDGKANHPVVFVSYNDAIKYCKWLETQHSGYAFRLPTVEEWEYAAVGNNNYAYPWGNEISTDKFNYNKVVASVYLQQNPTVTYNNSKSSEYGKSYKLNQIIFLNANRGVQGWINHNNYTGFVYTDLFTKLMDDGGYTTSVNQYPDGKSPFGIYDMSGNTWDWTSSDIIAENGAEKGQTVKAIKGGSWYATANSCKVTMRGEGRRPQSGYNTVGFRVVAIKNDGTSQNYATQQNSTENNTNRIQKNYRNNTFSHGNTRPEPPKDKNGHYMKPPQGDTNRIVPPRYKNY